MKNLMIILIVPFIFACSMQTAPKFIDVYYIHTYESGVNKDDVNFCGEVYENSVLAFPMANADGMIVDLVLDTCKENNITPVKKVKGRTYIIAFDIPWTKKGCKDGSYAVHGFYGNAVKFGDNNTFVMAYDNRMSERDFQNMLGEMKGELKSCQ